MYPFLNKKYIDSIRGPHVPACELLVDPGVYMGVSKNRGGPPKWMVKIMENPTKMDDLGRFSVRSVTALCSVRTSDFFQTAKRSTSWHKLGFTSRSQDIFTVFFFQVESLPILTCHPLKRRCPIIPTLKHAKHRQNGPCSEGRRHYFHA